MAAPEGGAPAHTLLVFTALLRLLRAEVVRVRKEHSVTESHLRRATSRADNASSEIVALEEEVASLQADGSANGDMIRSLVQRIAKLESRLAEREEKLNDKEEELLSLQSSSRSVPRIWRADSSGPSTSCGLSTGRDCSESTDDDSASYSVYELSPVELESPSVWLAETESLLESERAMRIDLEEGFALLEAQLAAGNDAAELMREELGEARIVIGRLEKRAAVMEADRANALDVAADAEDALCAAETVTVNASEELQKAFARAATAEAEVASLRSRRAAEVQGGFTETETAQLLDAEQQRSRDVSQKQAFQSREMLDHFEQAHRERAEQQRQQIAALQERLAATEVDRDQKLRVLQCLDGERQDVLALQQSVALREAEWDERAQDSERRDRELDARCVEAAELAAELSAAKAAQDSVVQELRQQRQQCAAVSAERDLAWRVLERQEVGDEATPVEVPPVCATTELSSTESSRSGPQLVCGPEASGPAIVEDLLAQAVLLHQSSRASGSRKAPPTRQKQSDTPRVNPLLRQRSA